MSNFLYWECSSGISGDMAAASLLDLGADGEVLDRALKSLPVDGFDIKISRVKKSGIDACDFAVILDEAHENHDHDMEYLYGSQYGQGSGYCHTHKGGHEHGEAHSQEEGSGHGESHSQGESYGHEEGHSHGEGSGHGHKEAHRHGETGGHGINAMQEENSEPRGHSHRGAGHSSHSHGAGGQGAHIHTHTHQHTHRGLPEILEIIEQGDMSQQAKDLAGKIFRILAEAEAKAHGLPVEQVHFHEVGAVDSIVDIVAVAVCLDNLGIQNIIVPQLNEGKGTVRCQHGVLPVPVPAVANIAASHGLALHIMDRQGEFVTPTGAAIVAACGASNTLPEAFVIKKIGIGAGKRQYEGAAGLLRAMLIEEKRGGGHE